MVRGGGPRNMKYKGPPMAAIFFMTSFNRDRGGPWPPWLPPWIRSCKSNGNLADAERKGLKIAFLSSSRPNLSFFQMKTLIGCLFSASSWPLPQFLPRCFILASYYLPLSHCLFLSASSRSHLSRFWASSR